MACPRQACRRRHVGGGLSSAGLSSAGLSSAALTSAALSSASLSTAGLSSAGLSSEACRQQACISWLVVSSFDIGRLEDDRLVIGGLVLGRLVVGRLVISGLVLGLTSAGWARSSSSSESRPVGQCGITVVDRRGIFVQAQHRGYRRRVTYAGAFEKPPTSPSLGRSGPWSASRGREREGRLRPKVMSVHTH